MINEAIILAGGKGTRLRSVIHDIPKPMANISGRPFLEYQLEYLIHNKIKTVIISTGYKGDYIKKYFGDTYKNLRIKYSHEEEPLGTGGAIAKAINISSEKDVLILNGDTFYPISINKLYYLHNFFSSKFSIALREINSSGRFGSIEIDDSFSINNFCSKDILGNIQINGGIYIIDTSYYKKNITQKRQIFSLEDDFLKNAKSSDDIKAFPFNEYFIDIGIPEDYLLANEELKFNTKSNKKYKYLLLDRDGVINEKISNGYVTSIETFAFIDGVEESFKTLSENFEKIFIVTNQRGIARGMISVERIQQIHDFMTSTLNNYRNKIEKIYICPHEISENCNCRKPKPGLFEQLVYDYPFVNNTNALMIGDSFSDMIFAKKLNIDSIYLHNGTIEKESTQYGFEIYENLKEYTDFYFK